MQYNTYKQKAVPANRSIITLSLTTVPKIFAAMTTTDTVLKSIVLQGSNN